MKMITGDTGSLTCLAMLRSRLNDCRQTHKSCRESPDAPLPARVLQITVKEEGKLAVQLIQTNGRTGRYLCLSHRWIEGQTITTTTSNMNIDWRGFHGTSFPKHSKRPLLLLKRSVSGTSGSTLLPSIKTSHPVTGSLRHRKWRSTTRMLL